MIPASPLDLTSAPNQPATGTFLTGAGQIVGTPLGAGNAATMQIAPVVMQLQPGIGDYYTIDDAGAML